VIFLEPIRLYRAVKEEVAKGSYEVPIGRARLAREGADVTLVAWGAMMRETMEAASRLEEEGVDAEVVDLRSLVPLDVDALVGSARKTGRVVIVHEAPRTAGLAGELIALIQERALYSLQAPVVRVTGWDTVFPLKRSEHLYLPSVDRIAAGVRRVMEG
jgi:pyruvate dehydrogenase E1 component beta subunit